MARTGNKKAGTQNKNAASDTKSAAKAKSSVSDSSKEKKIDRFLKDVTQQLEEMEAGYTDLSKKLPAPARKIEERILTLQEEMDEISDKMLAYKLKRIASSKMLETVGEQKNSLKQTRSKKKAKSKLAQRSKLPAPASPAKSSLKLDEDDYESSTFKCKSDLNRCLLSSNGALDKALCFTLFIRCAIKG